MIWSARVSALLPLRSVTISFVVIMSVAFTPSVERSQSRSTRDFTPPSIFIGTSFHGPSFSFTNCTTCASPTSSLALPISLTSSLAGETRSFCGSSKSMAGSRSGEARISYSGLNLFSKPVFAAFKETRYVPDDDIGRRAVIRPSGSATSGTSVTALPRSTSSLPLSTFWLAVIFNSTSVPSIAVSPPLSSFTVLSGNFV